VEGVEGEELAPEQKLELARRLHLGLEKASDEAGELTLDGGPLSDELAEVEGEAGGSTVARKAAVDAESVARLVDDRLGADAREIGVMEEGAEGRVNFLGAAERLRACFAQSKPAV